MSIVRAAFSRVPRNSRHRGELYFRSGRVTILDADDHRINAEVIGTETYDVALTAEDHVLWVGCSCPYYWSELAPCKHVWATLLAVDSHGLSLKLPSAFDIEVDSEGYHFEHERRGEGDPFDDPGGAGRGRRPERRDDRDASVDWKTLHASMRAAMMDPSVEREVLYRIGLEPTRTGGRLTLDILERRRRRDGRWGKLRQASIPEDGIEAIPDPDDRDILSILVDRQTTTTGWYSSSPPFKVPSTLQMRIHTARWLLPLLCRTGRCFLQGAAQEPPGTQLQWDDGEPWELALEIRRREERDFVVTGHLRRGEERMDLSEPDLLLAGGLVFYHGRVARSIDFGAFQWVVALRQATQVIVPAPEGEMLVSEMLMLEEHPHLDLPEELQFTTTQATPRPRLRVFTAGGDSPDRQLRAELSFDYQGEFVPAHAGPARLVRRRDKSVVVRDEALERRAEQRLHDLGLRARGRAEAEMTLWLRPRALPGVARELVGEGWIVEAEGRLYRRAGSFNIGVTSGMDWFEVRGSAAFGDESVALPDLLAAARRGDNVVRLGDGSVGVLPEEWLKRIEPLVAFGSTEEDHLRFSRGQVGLLDVLLAQQPEVDLDARFARARDELAGFEGVKPVDAPRGFRGRLRGYQEEGLGWLLFLQNFGLGGCLADDMGLGKTVQVLALLQSRRAEDGTPRPSLVVVPRSLIFNWSEEAARFTPELSVLVHTGPERRGDDAGFLRHDVVLTTYGTLRRDAAWLKDFRFDYAILDEAQAIKNPSTQAAKAARLVQADHRLTMSGTPIENHLGELWSLFEFINPGMLGRVSAFENLVGKGGSFDPDRADTFARALRPFILRRTKDQVAPELPAKTEQTLHCELGPGQRKDYDELRAHYRAVLGRRIESGGIGGAKIQILEALLRLRQAACHPGLIDASRSDEPSAKLDALLPQLMEVLDEGHKALVFSQFTSLLRIVRDRLDREGVTYTYLDGRTRDRASRVDRFQNDPDCRLFLISLKAGGLGLNLTAAEYVFLLDPWWNPAVEAQAIDRTHRIGQTRQVFAYRIVARDTVEEKILQLQEKKRELADAIIQADGSLISNLGREELELLLS